MLINPSQVSKKLAALGFEDLAAQCGLDNSNVHKISPFFLVLSFFHCFGQGNVSLQSWANSLMELFQVSVSKQAIDKRLSGFRYLDFCRELFNRVLKQNYSEGHLAMLANYQARAKHSSIPSLFNRVLIQDSSCIKLLSGCEQFFPGAHSSKGPSATAKVQLTMDLVSDQPIDILLTHFRKNDQGDAKRIVEQLQPKDLLIRDMGYFVNEAFGLITQAEAFFLSRLKSGVKIYQAGSSTPVDLLKLCQQSSKRGITQFDGYFELGRRERLPVRLIICQLSQSCYQTRRRKALKDRSSKANHSKRYLKMLQWQLLITNAEQEVLPIAQAVKLYRLRWRVEIIFKCWKSGTELNRLFTKKQSMKPTRCEITLYLLLIDLLLFGYNTFWRVRKAVYEQHGRFLSALKWFKFIKSCTSLEPDQLLSQNMIQHFARACCYEKRRRKSHAELLYVNLSG